MDGLNAVDDGLLDYLCFFVVVVVVVLVLCALSGFVVGFGVEVACSWLRRCVERGGARRSCVAVRFAHVDGLAALWAGVKDVVLGDTLHLR